MRLHLVQLLSLRKPQVMHFFHIHIFLFLYTRLDCHGNISSLRFHADLGWWGALFTAGHGHEGGDLLGAGDVGHEGVALVLFCLSLLKKQRRMNRTSQLPLPPRIQIVLRRLVLPPTIFLPLRHHSSRNIFLKTLQFRCSILTRKAPFFRCFN
jgi:hypothetical protein